MKKISKIIITALLTCAMLPTASLALEFTDMPDNWTTGALERAVENGLLKGDDGKIMPDDNIKRSEMAAIIVRAFGATKEADISMYPDVYQDKWYYSEFAKAVEMGAFKGTDDGKLNPDAPIKYEECFTVISRIFCLPDGDIHNEANYANIDETVLDTYSDAKDIASWARKDTALVVSKGYWNGYENKLKPQNEYITRSEFAVLMDNLIKVYINEPGEYKEFAEGNILIRSNDVVLDGYTGDAVILVGDGVSSKTYLKNLKSTNEIVVRGGTTVITGEIRHASVIGEGTKLDINNMTGKAERIFIDEGTELIKDEIEYTPGM